MLDSFIQYLVTEKRFSEHTCLAYKKDITQFIEFADISTENDFKEVESSLIRGWMVSLLENDYSPNSVNRKISSLKTFFKWMLKEGVLIKNPAHSISGPKSSKRLPSFVQQKDLQIEKVEALFSDDFEGVRDQLMVEVFYQTGIRSSELVNLKDVNVSNVSVKVLGKRNKERIIPISGPLYELVSKYRLSRMEIEPNSEFFFILNSGKKLYPKFVYRKINAYLGRATELEKKSPHVLRHTFATHMLNSGAGLEVLKELLGHANLSATQIYTHNSFAQLTSIYSQSHPRGHKK
ncbi:MAG: tyrosine-type recombinase/integrase [Fluviicola sp.]|nr:tyrosine-type recombinase/integrase [Fluviicola sp.]